MNRARKMIGLDRAIENTLTGKGVAIAVMDTGIAPHPDLERHRIAFTDYINGHTQPYDDNGHGTHIAGIIAGNGRASNGRYKGIAPESSLYCMKVLDAQGNGNSGLLAQALSDLIEIYQRRNIRIVNISVGSMPGKDSGELKQMMQLVDMAWDKGLVIVTAAGNTGPARESVTCPGIHKKVITVGALEEGQPDQGYLRAGYSGRGPTKECVVKPELVAPGNAITSMGTGYRLYETKSGTSMSTAIVSGLIALLLQKEPNLTPNEVKLRLMQSCVKGSGISNQEGLGLISAKKLFEN
jgi:serine protease AprX